MEIVVDVHGVDVFGQFEVGDQHNLFAVVDAQDGETGAFGRFRDAAFVPQEGPDFLVFSADADEQVLPVLS